MPVSKIAKVSCDDCFFQRNLLCALDCGGPCPTFRPDHPDGLRPPQQLHFVFRQERRRQAAWAFPSAEEQAALHSEELAALRSEQQPAPRSSSPDSRDRVRAGCG